MAAVVRLGDLSVDVVRKDVRNVHLSVHPPAGRVRIAAPSSMSLDTIRVFAVSKLGWIRTQQRKLREQARETRREYLERESHYLWGRRHLLRVIEGPGHVWIELRARRVVFHVRPGTTASRRQELVEAWYRQQLRNAVAPMIAKWARRLGVCAPTVFIQRMRTRWGSCSPRSGNIRLNTELAKKPLECVEYVVVHELLHLLEPTHGTRFVALMDRAIPQWPHLRKQLNQLPVRHEDWTY